MGHLHPHKRDPQKPSDDRTSAAPQQIAAPTATVDDTAPIVTAAFNSAYTTITTAQTFVSSVADGGLTTQTVVSTISITDAAQYASLTSAEARASSLSHTTTSKAPTPTSTSTASSAKTSSNLNILIPAIVAPVAFVLVASLALFWFCMRRRHRKELESQPDLAKAGRGEKLNSRTNSSRSVGSTSIKTFEKSFPLATVVEASPSQLPRFAAPEDIGVARPLTPKDIEMSSPRAGFSPYGPLGPNRTYQNFSGPRPSTARRPSTSRGEEVANRHRSNSSPSKRFLPAPSYGHDSNWGSALGTAPRSGPSPTLRISPAIGLAIGLPSNPRQNEPPRLRDPSPTMNRASRAEPPAPLRPPPPGAFNGASSISQYSPIVKDTPLIGGNPIGNRAAPPRLNTSNVNKPRAASPLSPEHALTEENMRIARLANSSRLGFNGEQSSSPKLPPPATRSQLIPADSPQSAENFFGLPEVKRRDTYRDSTVSAPDEFEDVDAKSDVSSLNELERFEFESINGSRAGSGIVDLYGPPDAGGRSGRGSPFVAAGAASSTGGRW